MNIQTEHKRRMLRRHLPKLPPTLSKHCMSTISTFVVNDHGQANLKFEDDKKILNISGYSVS